MNTHADTDADTDTRQQQQPEQGRLLPQAKALQSHLGSRSNDPFSFQKTPAGYAQRALFATNSRLLTCLVNENIVDAYFLEYGHTAATCCIVFVPSGTSPASPESDHGYMVSQIRHRPVVSAEQVAGQSDVQRVRFLDPEDLGALQWIRRSQSGTPALVAAPEQIMAVVGEWNSYDEDKIAAICSELASSVENQAQAYQIHRPELDILTSTAIEWEQSIIEGHATHPMHRARYAVPPLDPISPDADLFHLQLTFVAVPRDEIR
ncbi:hypothetical protein GGI07_004857, partial [Coemansia sp. Benny D115]